MENAVQVEKDPDGKTWTIETGIQYTPESLPRLQLLLEPTFWEWEVPKGGPTVSGLGDTDVTVAYVLVPDDGPWPAVILAGKVKLPTADDRDIGTGKADTSGLLILGKEFGDLDIGLELEFATFGDPPAEPVEPAPAGEPPDPDEIAAETPGAAEETELKDQFIYTFSAEYGLTEDLSVFAELFGNTKPARDESATNGALIGLEFDVQLTEYASPFVTVEFDTEELFAAKVGVEWAW